MNAFTDFIFAALSIFWAIMGLGALLRGNTHEAWRFQIMMLLTLIAAKT